MKFRRLAIQSYRSIVKADLKLGHITVIIGPSDTGKSNVIRALRDWCYNATGTGMITKGKKVCRVAVAVGEDHKVVFEKSLEDTKRGRARYILKDGITHETLSFEKIGRTVPEAIQEITGIKLLEVDDLSIRMNLSEQSDPWFLLANPPWSISKISRVVGKISGVDALLLANKDVAATGAAYKRAIKSHQEKIARLESQLEENMWVEEFDVDIGEAEGLLNECDENKKTISDSIELLKSIKAANKILKKDTDFLDLASPILQEVQSFDISANQVLDAVIEISNGVKRKEMLYKKQLQWIEHRESELSEAKAELLEVIESDVECPVCGESAHKECLSNLKKQAQ